MMINNRMFKILTAPHVSEKSTIVIDKYHTIVLKVFHNANKIEIASMMQQLFSVKIKKVNILIVKGKRKRLSSGKYSKQSNWKKAYVTLCEGEKLDFLDMKK